MDDLLNTDLPIESCVVDDSVVSQTLKGDHFPELTLYTQDKENDIKYKIALLTNIDPYKQYVWAKNARQSLDGNDYSIFSHWHTSVRRIEGYPIDGHTPHGGAPLTIEDIEESLLLYLHAFANSFLKY